LSTISGLFSYLLARGDVAANPVLRCLPTRREQHGSRPTVPLIRRLRTLPTILSQVEADRLLAALRTLRDTTMVTAMLLGGCVAAQIDATTQSTKLPLS
jgi:hypothetical protein